MAIITFTSDFGYSDHYVAAVKAKILTINHTQKIVDITHAVDKFDIMHAAYVFSNIYKDFPPGTVHIVAVNSFNELNEKSIAVKYDNQYIVCSDNTFISLIGDGILKPTAIVNLLEKVDTKNSTFPAKDIYAAAAIFLANGGNFYELGPEMEEYKSATFWYPSIRRNEITGLITRIDSYGNGIVNVSKKDFEGIGKGRNFTLSFSRYQLTKIVSNYNEIKGGEIGALFNVNNMLEIFVNKGNANELIGLGFQDNVFIEFNKDTEPVL